MTATATVELEDLLRDFRQWLAEHSPDEFITHTGQRLFKKIRWAFFDAYHYQPASIYIPQIKQWMRGPIAHWLTEGNFYHKRGMYLASLNL